jgi:uncharacterized protein (DUF2267 family)
MEHSIKAIQASLNQTHVWIRDLMESYDYADENQAFVLLRATLKALRDRISTNEAFHLATQLPAIVRGFYFEGWDPSQHPQKAKSSEEFLHSVSKHLGGHNHIDLEMAVPCALEIIFEHIDQGEAEQVKRNLPAEIHELFS